MNIRDVKVVARFELSRVSKTPGGALFLALGGTLYGYMFLQLAKISKEIGAADPGIQKIANEGAKLAHSALGWVTDLDASDIGTMIADHNPALLTFFMLSLALTPFLAILASFDQIGTDISSRHIRYLLLRTDRASLYFGKFLATVLFYAMGMAVVTICAGLIIGYSGDLGDGGILYLGRIWLTQVFFSIPFIAFTAMCGAMTGHAAMTLLMAIGIQFGVWLVSFVGKRVNELAVNVKYAFASAMKYDLAVDTIATVGTAAGYMALWGLVMFTIGRAVFARRDV